MNISSIFDGVVQYISGAVVRIFSPTDDSYPTTGVQPFEGSPFDESRSNDW